MPLECDISESIKHLRRLREDLCEKEKIWQEAYKARDYVVSALKEVYQLLSEDKLVECKSKLELIFKTLNENI